MKVKTESERVGLMLNIQKTKIMASGPITSWQIDGETMTDFILGGSKITADGDCSHKIKRQVLRPCVLGRPRGIWWRGRWEGGSGWGIHVTPWLIHVSV